MNVESFLQSMPKSYALAFDRPTAGAHARIVSARQGRLVHVALWQASRNADAVLCVVADDEPGLLSLVCAGFVAHQIDVHAAQIFSRKVANHPDEAVDFFWVRAFGDRGFEPVTEKHVSALRQTLEKFIGRARPDDGPAPSRAPVSSTLRSKSGPEVRFDEGALARGKSVLVLEAADSPGLLLAITRAVSGQGVNIAASDVRTVGGIAQDRFVLERDGSPLSDAGTRERVLRAVRASLEASSSRPPARKLAR